MHRSGRQIMASLGLGLVLGYASVAGGAEPPHLFLSTNDILRLKTSKAAHVQRAIQQNLAAAENLLHETIEVPTRGGNWIFYMDCPKDGATLHRVMEGVFVCPVEHTTNANEKAEGAYRTTLHDRAAHASETTALAYAMTGRREFADKAAAILLKYADLYPGYTRHDRWGRTGLLAFMGGLRYAQALDEAVNLIPCAWAYDLIASSGALTAAQQSHIESDFLRAAARQLQVHTFQEDNNHQTWINAGIASVGFTLNDRELIDLSITGRYGLYYQMTNCVTSDGLWHEGTMAYQSYAMQPLVMHAEMARKNGRPVCSNETLKSLFDGPLRSAFPDGSYPIINDSDPFNIGSLADLYEWAYAVYGDPQYGAVALRSQRGGKWAWLVGADVLPVAGGGALVQGSRNLPGIGYLFLERPFAGAPASLVVDYGPHGGGHGHPDKLSITLFALGRDLFVDPGRITYSVPEYKSWCHQTVAHNTVVADEESQAPANGECLWFTSDSNMVAACFRSLGAYSRCDLRRIVAMTDRYILDAFRVEARKERQWDWCLHVRGTLTATNGWAPKAKGLGQSNGYQHLSGVSGREGSTPATLSWQIDASHALRLLAAPTPKTEAWFAGHGIGTALHDSVPFLIRRQQATTAVFSAVYEITSHATGRVSAVTQVSGGKDRDNILALRVAMADTLDATNRWDEWHLPWEWIGRANAAGREPTDPAMLTGFQFRPDLKGLDQ